MGWLKRRSGSWTPWGPWYSARKGSSAWRSPASSPAATCLLEDIPGIGKTTLALSLARVLGLRFGRIQFTSDLLPADITGTSVFNAKDQSTAFRSRAHLPPSRPRR